MRVVIHATNIRGLGATQVVRSLLPPLLERLEGHRVLLCLPEGWELEGSLRVPAGCEVARRKRWLPNALSRFLECVLPPRSLREAEKLLVLGDIPIRGSRDQVVLAHQPHLALPRVNPDVATSPRYRIMRSLFRMNLGYAKYVVVQTGMMRDQLIASYGLSPERIRIIPQPVPDWFHFDAQRGGSGGGEAAAGLTLFYPAAGYPHKNHKIFAEMARSYDAAGFPFRVIVTLPEAELSPELRALPWLEPVGRLAPRDCLERYHQVDALFFPSLLESYGLPLIEAMGAGLPIVCSDLPYARWLCGDQAIYFNPQSGRSAVEAVCELHRRRAQGLRPDWTETLSGLPRDWEDVARRFVALVEESIRAEELR